MNELFIDAVTKEEVEQKLKPGAKVMIGFEPVENIPHTMLLLIETLKQLKDNYRYCANSAVRG